MSKVFYSWQSDTASAANRSFILNALEQACQRIRKDETIEVDPVVDRDTAGVPGTTNIAETILKKIEEASVFVGDVTIINQHASALEKFRPTPNPNVLTELGYAMKALGKDKFICDADKYGNLMSGCAQTQAAC